MEMLRFVLSLLACCKISSKSVSRRILFTYKACDNFLPHGLACICLVRV